MEILLAVAIGVLYASGFYLILRRSAVRIILGLALLAHGANLLLFVSGGLVRGGAPLVPEGAAALAPPHADPLPQALVLTAIVISFAVLAFALVLFYRAGERTGVVDVARLGEATAGRPAETAPEGEEEER